MAFARARLVLALFVTGASASATACGGGARGFTGKWESSIGGVTLELKGDKTAKITIVGVERDGTWEVTGKNQIVVHGPDDLALTLGKDGALEGGMGARFVRAK